MSYSTYIRMELAETKLTSGFFDTLDEAFRSHGLMPQDEITVVRPRPEFAHSLARKELINYLPRIDAVLLCYLADGSEDLYMKVFTGVSKELTSELLLITASMEKRLGYTEKEKARALKVEAVTLQLHQKLNALDSSGQSEYSETNWFHFSKDEWKTMGDLPVCEDD